MNRMNAFSQFKNIFTIYKLSYIECFFGFDNYLPFIQVHGDDWNTQNNTVHL